MRVTPEAKGTIHAVGLGPGAPDLMSVRADRLVRETQHIAYFRKVGRPGQARSIVDGMLRPDAQELPMEYPITTEIPVADPLYRKTLAAFYAAGATQLRALSEQGHDIAVLCEGDPMFFGSFMHLFTRLSGAAPIRIVPGIAGMAGATAAAGLPLVWGDDTLAVLAGTMPWEKLAERIRQADALVVMKCGRHLTKVRQALSEAGRLADAWLIEYATMPGERVQPLSQHNGSPAPYFSLIVVPGRGRRS